jgi:hypothetical protein
MRSKLFLWMLCLCLLPVVASAVTKVGNGDDGSDLEGAVLIDSGPILEARDKAVGLLKRLDTPSIRGLGLLLPEVERAAIYRAPDDRRSTAKGDSGPYHVDMTGAVYARTMPSPHAPVRFFPIAERLSEPQLIALHVHEGLHRALPAPIREDEGVVADITLALTGPDATRDQVSELMARVAPDNDLRITPPAGGTYQSSVGRAIFDEDHFKQPSSLGVSFKQFFSPPDPANFPIARMYSLHSYLYPFGGANTPFGLGIEGSFIEAEKGPQIGPLGLSARLRLWSRRDFDIGIWASAAFNTLSAEELKNSPFGRDVFTLGTTMRKNLSLFFVENQISVALPGSSSQRIGKVAYLYEYGTVISAKVRGGVKLGRFDAGAFAEINLADFFRVNGGAFSIDTGRYRLLSVGPELSYTHDDFAVSLTGRFLANATKDANYDFLGNLMGPGVAQGSIGLSVSTFF